MRPETRDVSPMPGHLVITRDAYYGIILEARLGLDLEHHEWDVMLADGLTVSLPREGFRLVPMQAEDDGLPPAGAACFVELVRAYNARRPRR